MTIDGALFRFIPKYDRSIISEKLLDLKLDGIHHLIALGSGVCDGLIAHTYMPWGERLDGVSATPVVAQISPYRLNNL